MVETFQAEESTSEAIDDKAYAESLVIEEAKASLGQLEEDMSEEIPADTDDGLRDKAKKFLHLDWFSWSAESSKNPAGYPFARHEREFWDDNDLYFQKNLVPKSMTLTRGVKIIRDAWLYFYVVQAKDTLEWIRTKLSGTKEFAYLHDDEYNLAKHPSNKTQSFNISPDDIKPGMLIPIPLDYHDREISSQDFTNYCHEAIQEMQMKWSHYTETIKTLLKKVSEKDVLISMLAFARSESAGDTSWFTKPLGDVELHRWEQRYKAFSFTYFHILMEKTADRKTNWPGLQARLNLWLTEGQCYHPKNAAKLFLAYRIEKTKWDFKITLANGKTVTVFPLTKNNLTVSGTTFNGSQEYTNKLAPNFDFATKLLNKEIVYYNNAPLEKIWFVYKWLNSKYKHVFSFNPPNATLHTVAELKNYVVQTFNKHKAASCPAITPNNVVKMWGQPLPLAEKTIPDSVCVVLPSK